MVLSNDGFVTDVTSAKLGQTASAALIGYQIYCRLKIEA